MLATHRARPRPEGQTAKLTGAGTVVTLTSRLMTASRNVNPVVNIVGRSGSIGVDGVLAQSTRHFSSMVHSGQQCPGYTIRPTYRSIDGPLAPRRSPASFHTRRMHAQSLTADSLVGHSHRRVNRRRVRMDSNSWLTRPVIMMDSRPDALGGPCSKPQPRRVDPTRLVRHSDLALELTSSQLEVAKGVSKMDGRMAPA
jgi:hypothetical protein